MKKVQKSHKIQVPHGKVGYQLGGTTFVVDEKYEVIKQIGSGAYGIVASALNRSTNQKVAIKKVINAFEDLIDAKRILRQIKLLSIIDNIIGIRDILKPQSKTNYNDIYIVTELMETDLHRVIYSRQQLTYDHIQYFMYQILKGLQFMHSSHVIHRDIKPSNLLLNKTCDLKICDLGLARGYVQQQQQKTQYVVTRWYRAPEVILNASDYTKSVDIWSVGCIFAELIGRTPLFPGQDFLDQVQRIISVLGTPSHQDMKYIGNQNALKYIKSLPKRSKQNWEKLFPEIKPQAADLLTKMLAFNPQKRYSAEDCLSHPYFDGFQKCEDMVAKKVFDWQWDDFKPTKDMLQTMIYQESLSFETDKKIIRQKNKGKQIKQSIMKPNYKMSK